MVEFHLAALKDLHSDRPLRVDFFGRPVLVYRVDDRPVATLDICTHAGGPLELSDGCLRCSWHGARFDAAHGLAESSPAEREARLTQLPLEVRPDGSVWYVYGQPPAPGARSYPVTPRQEARPATTHT